MLELFLKIFSSLKPASVELPFLLVGSCLIPYSFLCCYQLTASFSSFVVFILLQLIVVVNNFLKFFQKLFSLLKNCICLLQVVVYYSLL